MKKFSTEEFIEKARTVHKNKYSYDRVNYNGFSNKVEIRCSIHGYFYQQPQHHLNGHGCSKCAFEKVAKLKRKKKEDFIIQANKIHKNKYNYDKVNYKNNREKVIIICKKHGEFLQKPIHHLIGSGCPKCGGRVKFTTKEFIEKCRKVHGNKYDYSKVEYKSNREKIIIICYEHGEFEQRAGTHVRGANCLECQNLKKVDTKEFIKRARKVHGNKYDYSKSNYVNKKTKVIIICKQHGEFVQSPAVHTRGFGCSKCSGTYNPTTYEFIKLAKKVHGNKYDYSKVDYKNNRKKIIIICKKHGEFLQQPGNHLGGHGCPKCVGRISKMSQEWLNKLEIPQEYREKYVRFKNGHIFADALKDNIVYEFDHPFWHGGDGIDLNEIHPIIKIKFKDLFNKTLKRRNKLIKNGFTVVQTCNGKDNIIYFPNGTVSSKNMRELKKWKKLANC